MKLVRYDENIGFALEVEARDDGLRIDKALARVFGEQENFEESELPLLSRSQIVGLIESGNICHHDKVAAKRSQIVRVGEVLHVKLARVGVVDISPDPTIEFEILFEDSEVAVINKPPGLVVHPGSGNREKTLVHGLLARLSHFELSGERPGIVHRLDKDTSGLMVVAKTARAYHALVSQFLPPRSVKRLYRALCVSFPRRHTRYDENKNSGSIDLAIARHPTRRTVMAVSDCGRAATTRWKIVNGCALYTELELELETGRTHQIRVHLHATGAPIFGDPVYGPSKQALDNRVALAAGRLGRQALHATELTFLHPRTGDRLKFQSAIPDDIRAFRSTLEEMIANS